MKHLYLNVKTSGLNPEVNQILQFAAIVTNDFYGDEVEEARINIHLPLCECADMDAKALQVNGIDVNELAGTTIKQEDLKVFASPIVKFLTEHVTPDTKIIGHNVNFHIGFLRDFLSHLNYDISNLLDRRMIIDTISIGYFLQDAGYIKPKSLTLKKLAETLDINFEQSSKRDAMFEAALTGTIYLTMRDLLDK
jgi:DNA polymerase III epsilon subunit-like protein